MMGNLIMEKYKIVLVPFPFDDFKTIKVRPAICLTNKIGSLNHIVIAFISSQIPLNPFKYDVLIKSREKEFSITGLKTNSIIRLHRMVTLPANLIRRELGFLPKKYHKELNEKIKQLFEL